MDKWYLRIGRASEIDNPRDRRLYRVLEIMPGVLAWSTFYILLLREAQQHRYHAE